MIIESILDMKCLNLRKAKDHAQHRLGAALTWRSTGPATHRPNDMQVQRCLPGPALELHAAQRPVCCAAASGFVLGVQLGVLGDVACSRSGLIVL